MNRKVGMVATIVVGAVALVACGSSGGSKSDSGADTTSTTKSADTSSTTAPGAKATLQLVDTSLGKVVAGADGKVLYLYKPDGTSEQSTVPAGILAIWPPLVAKTAPTVGTGLQQSLVSTGTQPSGAKWVRYNGHLLYGFTSDAAPGDTNGNGLGNVWYAVTADGNAVGS
jgi:predicted lipoprotein with Yx(FWY)xxD motif